MFQPFERFKPVYLQRILKLGKKYLVSQSYSRAFDHLQEYPAIAILVTDYDDLNYAQVHCNAIKSDQYAAIIHLGDELHKKKLVEMMEGNRYTLYWAVVSSTKSLQERLNTRFKDHVRRYIQKNTTWRISGESKINPKFEVIFGELFIIIKYGSQVVRVKFEEIEKS